MEYRFVDGIWSVRRTRGWEKPRPTRVVKYELGSVPGRASPGYSDLRVGIPSGGRDERAEHQIGRGHEGERRGSGRIRKYVAAAQHVARNLWRLAAGGIWPFGRRVIAAGLRRDSGFETNRHILDEYDYDTIESVTKAPRQLQIKIYLYGTICRVISRKNIKLTYNVITIWLIYPILHSTENNFLKMNEPQVDSNRINQNSALKTHVSLNNY